MRIVDIFGVNFSVTNYQNATDLIYSVFALPVHGVVESRRDLIFKNAVLNADIVVPDGQPVRWAMNYFYNADLLDRVYGPKLTLLVLKESNRRKLRLFLYGGSTEKVLSNFQKFIQENFPQIIICGAYREKEFGLETLSEDMLRRAQPDIVLVGLGCPTQEKWVDRNKNRVKAVYMGVGAAFSFYAGETKIAPRWMQKRGLEWLFRLFSEPRRLWRRYLFTNSYFIWLVITKLFISNCRRDS